MCVSVFWANLCVEGVYSRRTKSIGQTSLSRKRVVAAHTANVAVVAIVVLVPVAVDVVVVVFAGQLASQHLRVPDKLPRNMLQLK